MSKKGVNTGIFNEVDNGNRNQTINAPGTIRINFGNNN